MARQDATTVDQRGATRRDLQRLIGNQRALGVVKQLIAAVEIDRAGRLDQAAYIGERTCRSGDILTGTKHTTVIVEGARFEVHIVASKSALTIVYLGCRNLHQLIGDYGAIAVVEYLSAAVELYAAHRLYGAARIGKRTNGTGEILTGSKHASAIVKNAHIKIQDIGGNDALGIAYLARTQLKRAGGGKLPLAVVEEARCREVGVRAGRSERAILVTRVAPLPTMAPPVLSSVPMVVVTFSCLPPIWPPLRLTRLPAVICVLSAPLNMPPVLFSVLVALNTTLPCELPRVPPVLSSVVAVT